MGYIEQETDWALVKRINRVLGENGERLRKTRGGFQAHLDLGDFWIQDFNRNLVISTYVDPEELRKELGIL